MSQYTKIEWADHTFNPWIGCQAISPGCANCYAAAWTKRYGRNFADRTLTKTWAQPRLWNAQAEAFHAQHGRRQRVFCASLADVFDNEVPLEWRSELFMLISETPNLDWLILTKRIGNAAKMLPAWYQDPEAWEFGNGVAHPNVWLGATVVNQEEADRDIPKLLATPARVRFLSMEPLLGAVDLSKWLDPWTCSNCYYHGSEADSSPCRCDKCGVETVYDDAIGSDRCPSCDRDNGTSDCVGDSCPECESVERWGRDYGFKFDSEKPSLLDWVIVGGESGPGARPMHPDWARSLRDQCAAAGLPFLFKQWGEHTAGEPATHPGYPDDKASAWRLDQRGQRWNDPQETPATMAPIKFLKVGKKAAGRLLDGIEHNGFPV